MLYLKDTQKWKQFTTWSNSSWITSKLCYISKILKNESNSQQEQTLSTSNHCCVISQRYSKMKAIHNHFKTRRWRYRVVLYLKDTQKWKQFTTNTRGLIGRASLCYISKILKNESNSQHLIKVRLDEASCVISQRYSKMKAIHNEDLTSNELFKVVLYLKDTQKWKQFTTAVWD